MRQTRTKLTCHGDDLVCEGHLRAVQGGGQVWIFAVECMQKYRLQLGQRARVRVVPSPPTKQFDLTDPQEGGGCTGSDSRRLVNHAVGLLGFGAG
jgi:hypothetical protein